MAGNTVKREDSSPKHDFNPTLDLLGWEIKRIQDSFKEILGDDLASLPTEIQEDVEKIREALKHLRAFHESLYDILAKDQSPEMISHARHDMRGFTGGVTGYSELILEDLNPDQKILKSRFSKLIGKANHLLEVIDKLTLKETEDPLIEAEPSIFPHEVIKGRILIVDDSPNKRELLTRHLQPNGHRILTAEDGIEALEMVKKNPVDLILLDILMPKMNGYEVLNALKEEKKTRDIPVLVISSVSELESVVKCIQQGAEDYLPLPVNTVLLHARVNACLNKKQMLDREQENIQKLNEARQRLETAIESIEEGFAIFDAKDRLIMSNNIFKEMYASTKTLGYLGFSYQKFLTQNIKEGAYFKEKRQKKAPKEEMSHKEWLKDRLARHKNPRGSYVEHLCNGRWIEVLENKIAGGGVVAVHKDITERHAREQHMTHLATHDPLTNLANRALFEKTLSENIERSKKSGESFAVLFLDLDGFKQVNDQFGHEIGDQVLIDVAEKLPQCVREEDLVARLGGDEFCMILQEVGPGNDFKKILGRIFNAVGTSVTHENTVLPFGASIGIAFHPKDGDTFETVLAAADQAMYKAKKAGKGTCRFASEKNA